MPGGGATLARCSRNWSNGRSPNMSRGSICRCSYAALGEDETALVLFGRAVDAREPYALIAQYDPRWNRFRSNGRFDCSSVILMAPLVECRAGSVCAAERPERDSCSIQAGPLQHHAGLPANPVYDFGSGDRRCRHPC